MGYTYGAGRELDLVGLSHVLLLNLMVLDGKPNTKIDGEALAGYFFIQFMTSTVY